MNVANQFFEQQTGLQRWKFYDNIISRLRCTRDDKFQQVIPLSEPTCYDTPIFACKFAQKPQYQDFVAIANEDGKLAIHDTSSKTERYGGIAHNNAIFDLAWMFSNMKLVTASGDHTARLFDVAESDLREIKVFYGHTRSVKTVAFKRDDPSIFATGGRDGNIIIWDTRTDLGDFIGRPDRAINNSHNLDNCRVLTPRRKKTIITSNVMSGAKSVTGLVFQNDNTLISCGAGDGAIKIWDLRRTYCNFPSNLKHAPAPKATIHYSGYKGKNGFSSLTIDKESLKLYANCLDNSIYSYNLNNYTPLMKYTGHQNHTFYIKSCLSRDGSYLMSGSSDENAYIWNIKQSEPVVRLTGHCAEVTCVAWCEKDDNITLITCSDDMSHRIWRVGAEELPENWEIIGRGKAELIPNINTPKSKFKRLTLDDDTPRSNKKMIVTCDNCNNKTPSTSTSTSARNFCVDCRTESNANKRRYLEEISNNSKKLHKDLSPKRLFINKTEEKRDSENTSEDDEIARVLELPNFVIDGVAPHLIFSPPKKKAYDWLTKLRIEKQLLKRDALDSPPSSPKIPRLDIGVSNKKCSSPQSDILRYFKVKCEGHGNKVGNGGNVVISSPKSSQC